MSVVYSKIGSARAPACKECGHKFKFKANTAKKKGRPSFTGHGTSTNGNVAKIQSALSLIESLGGTKKAEEAMALLKKLEEL